MDSVMNKTQLAEKQHRDKIYNNQLQKKNRKDNKTTKKSNMN